MMERQTRGIKVVIQRRRQKLSYSGRDLQVIDVQSGQALPARDVRLDFPLNGIMIATVQLVVTDIEVIDVPESESD